MKRGKTEMPVTKSAEDIARRALTEPGSIFNVALDRYYRCVGALAQVLALTFQPYGGIYMAGESTKRNLAFIPQSGFLDELHKNEDKVYRDLLKKFPVTLLAGDLNLEGAAYLASQRL